MAVVDLIATIDFDSAPYADDDFLGGETDWNLYDVSGGDPRVDTHTDHKPGQVIDVSDVGVNIITHVDTMSDDDHWVEIQAYLDILTDSSESILGVVFRMSEQAASTMDGYGVYGWWHDTGPANEHKLHVAEYLNGSATILASSAQLNVTNGFHDNVTSGGNVLRGQIIGSDIKGYYNGEELVTATDSTYSTGVVVGMHMDRGDGDADDQIFTDDFCAGVFSPTTPHNFAWEGAIKQMTVGRVKDGTTASATWNSTPTVGNLLVAMYWGVEQDSWTFSTIPSEFGTDSPTVDIKDYGTFIGFGLSTKDSDGDEATESIVCSVSMSNLFFVMIEFESDWAFDAHDSDWQAADASPAVATTATLTAGDHIALTGGLDTPISGTYILEAESDIERNLINAKHQHEGTDAALLLGITDIGTSTTAHTTTVAANDSSYFGANAIVFYKAAGGPTSHPITASGAIVTGGSAAAVLVVAPISHPITASGSITTSGSAAASAIRPISASGSIVTGGSADVLVVRIISASGSIVTGGSAAAELVLAIVHSISASGSIVTGGSAASQLLTPISASGAIVTGGSAAAEVVPAITHSISASGAIVTGGSAAAMIPAVEHPITASGAIVTGGSAAILRILGVSASGSIVTDGSATAIGIFAIAASGSIATGGSAAAELVLASVIPISASGAIVTGGSAAAELVDAPVKPISASGAIITGGSAAAILNLGIAASGSIVTGGSASASIVSEPAEGIYVGDTLVMAMFVESVRVSRAYVGATTIWDV